MFINTKQVFTCFKEKPCASKIAFFLCEEVPTTTLRTFVFYVLIKKHILQNFLVSNTGQHCSPVSENVHLPKN